MATKTKREQLIEALLTLGYKEVHSSSSKYRAFEKLMVMADTSEGIHHLWVGKMGALRGGRNISSSYSLENRIPAYLGRADQERKNQAAIELGRDLMAVKRW